MADAKAIEDCKREISLLQVCHHCQRLSKNIFFFPATQSSQCDQIHLTFR